MVRLPAPRKIKRRYRPVDDARRVLESARQAHEALSAAFVLILVLGLRKREVPGLIWELVNPDTGELYVGEQVQRLGHRLIRASAGVPRITVHGTRKTCGSLLAALEVHPRMAMQILRHSKIAVTMEIHTEVPSAATRDAPRKLGQWLGSDTCCTRQQEGRSQRSQPASELGGRYWDRTSDLLGVN